jgi:predicted RNase H-like nuclease
MSELNARPAGQGSLHESRRVSLRPPCSLRSGITASFSPCEAAAKASMDCLEKNDYKRSQCLHVFEAYKNVRKHGYVCHSMVPGSLLIRSVQLAQRRADRRAGKDASLV